LKSFLESLQPWWVLGVVALGGAATVAGAFDPGYPKPLFSLGVALAILLLIALDLQQRFKDRTPRIFFDLEGPLLWILALWIFTRLLGPLGPHLTPLCAGLLAWLAVTQSRWVQFFSLGSAVVLDLGLSLAGRLELEALLLHILVYMGAAFALRAFAHSEIFRERLNEARQNRRRESAQAHKAGLLDLQTRQAPALTQLPSIGDQPKEELSLEILTGSFQLILDLLREALDLSTATLLWLERSQETLYLLSCSTDQEELKRGPYPAGAGIPGTVLRDVREISVVPGGRGRLPYHDELFQPGAIFAIALPEPEQVESGEPVAVLCVDRAEERIWDESERRLLRIAAQKLALDVFITQQLKHTDRKRHVVDLLCGGLKRLNNSLDLDQVAEAALAACQHLVPVDLALFSTLAHNPEEEGHEIIRAEGQQAERYNRLRFAPHEGLVGRAVELGHSLPAPGNQRANRAVFGSKDHLPQMKSLLILPLMSPEGEGLGALTLAAQEPGSCDRSPQRDWLELIAGQVAVRLELARAHERIKKLATVDGLTQLLNHRTFQQAFDTMLQRAKRQGGALCMILTDIDHFKNFNDTYGHPFGDEVLKGVARVLKEAVRQVDVAARYGGEEFALILEDSNKEGGLLMAERIRQEVEALRFEHESGPVGLTISLGLASFPEDGEEKSLLIERADQALYRAKEQGRNQVVLWDDETIS